MINRRNIGTSYEEKAAEHLQRAGFQILERNYRCRQGEIDLIAREGAYLVFIEVKYRTGSRIGHPAEAVDYRKQKRIIRAASYYCYVHGISEEHPCRFDVVCFLGERMEHIRNAFELQ